MLQWIHETIPYWDHDKTRIVGGADDESFPHQFEPLTAANHMGVLPGDWWRIQDGAEVLGYGWMDVTWGDAEMLVVVDPTKRRQGIGTEILDRLEDEARARGLNYLYNFVSPNHPARGEVVRWLRKRSFLAGDDGTLVRAVIRTVKARAS